MPCMWESHMWWKCLLQLQLSLAMKFGNNKEVRSVSTNQRELGTVGIHNMCIIIRSDDKNHALPEPPFGRYCVTHNILTICVSSWSQSQLSLCKTWNNPYSCAVLIDGTSCNSWGRGNSGKYYNAPMELAVESVCNDLVVQTLLCEELLLDQVHSWYDSKVELKTSVLIKTHIIFVHNTWFIKYVATCWGSLSSGRRWNLINRVVIKWLHC